MRRQAKVSAAVLVVAVVVYCVARTPRTEPSPPAEDESPVAGEELAPASEDAATEVVRRSPVEEEPRAGVPAVAGRSVLRVILEGITEENARLARVTVTGLVEGKSPGAKVEDAWSCQGRTSEFDLDPFFERVAARSAPLRDDELVVEVDHPQRFSEKASIPLSSGVEGNGGQTVYEARVRWAEVLFWPELTLTVRDASTRAHLEGVELRCAPTAFMGLWQRPGTGAPFTVVGDDLSSPIVLSGGRRADEPEDHAAGLALRPAAGEAPRLAELAQPEENDRGIMVYARAPGYAWGRLVLDVSKGAERELLLEPAAALGVRFANVQLERYAALEKEPTLCVTRISPDGEESGVWYQRLDEALATDGVRIEGLEPGELVVSVELGTAFSLRKRPVLAREELSLAAGATRELELVLTDAPAPPERATLGGVVSFPAFGGEDGVRLQLYEADYRYGAPDYELSLADMERTHGALPTWSFRLQRLPVGVYQVRLLPFEKSWMIELPAGGREDLELVIPELAEVHVETVDARTGERIPLRTIRYGYREDLAGRVHHDWSSARTTTGFEREPGRFRFWTAPGPAYVATYAIPSEVNIGIRRQDLDLVPGLQSVRFELAPACTLRFEFREAGAALPREDGIFVGLGRGIRAVGHEGRVSAVTYRVFEASAPGLYEVSFEGIGADRFQPIPPRRVEVRAGETTEVIVELRRR